MAVRWGLLGLSSGSSKWGASKGKSNCHASCVVAKPSFRTARGKHDDDARLCIKTFEPPSTDKKFFPTVCFDSEPKQRTPIKDTFHPSFAICAHLVLDKDLEETIKSANPHLRPAMLSNRVVDPSFPKAMLWNFRVSRIEVLAISSSMFCLFKWSDPRWLGLINLNWGAIRMQRQTSARSLWTGEIISNISYTFRSTNDLWAKTI